MKVQEHCGEVEHDDDFGYECEDVEVEVELPGGGGVPNWYGYGLDRRFP